MRYVLISLLVLASCVVLYGLIEVLVIKHNGAPIAAPDIPRSPQTSGTGQKLTYVVMGDSTAIGQGTEYKNSYATLTAKHLAQKYTVTLFNTGVSGANVQDVLTSQLDQAKKLKPDIVLLGVGANDTTHFTDLEEMRTALSKIIDGLKEANPNVQIIATRSPALDSVSRFPFVSKYILRMRTTQVNNIFDSVISANHIIPAHIAEKTRDAFLSDPSLTSPDNFHPNERGYGLWIPIINAALDQAIEKRRVIN